MCRHKGYTPEKKVHLERWSLEDTPDNFYATSYMQVAASAGLPIIVRDTVEGRNISNDAHWGLVPFFSKSLEEGKKTSFKYVNARAETVHDSRLYAPLLKHKQRCLIPCSYYYEHHHFQNGKVKVPFAVKADHRPLFAIPGLYTIYWKDNKKEEGFTSYTMFTTEANPLLAAIHNGGENSHRMPLVIDKDMEEDWLNPGTPDKVVQEILDYRIDAKRLRAWPVAPLTGKKAKAGEAVLDKEDWGEWNDEITAIEELAV